LLKKGQGAVSKVCSAVDFPFAQDNSWSCSSNPR